MQAVIFVREFESKGVYRSEPDFSPRFVSHDNPEGRFLVAVEPVHDELHYCFVPDGYCILGYARFITGTEGEAERKYEEYAAPRFHPKYRLVEDPDILKEMDENLPDYVRKYRVVGSVTKL